MSSYRNARVTPTVLIGTAVCHGILTAFVWEKNETSGLFCLATACLLWQ